MMENQSRHHLTNQIIVIKVLVLSQLHQISIEQGHKDMLIEYMVIIEVVIVVMVECVVVVANQQSAVVKWQPEQAYVKPNQSKPFLEDTESDRQE